MAPIAKRHDTIGHGWPPADDQLSFSGAWMFYAYGKDGFWRPECKSRLKAIQEARGFPLVSG